MDESPPLHILALSGGGYRGLYTATVLAELEASLGRPIASHFDLICGTSVGGILALGLANEIPAKELQNLFKNHGRKIFNSRSILRRLFGFWLTAKHDSNGLKDVLEKRFEDTTIGDLKHRVIIPTVNYTTGKVQVFKTPHHQNFSFDESMSLVDVALATSAAPVYFPLAKNKRGIFADGGLVANAPGLLGLHEARQFLSHSSPPRILSIGTMTIGTSISGSSFLSRGFGMWRGSLFDLVIAAQESSVDYMLKHELGDNYNKIDDTPSPEQCNDIKKLDRVSRGSTQTLEYRGTAAAQRTIGAPWFKPFRDHYARTPSFYHGPNKNCSEELC